MRRVCAQCGSDHESDTPYDAMVGTVFVFQPGGQVRSADFSKAFKQWRDSAVGTRDRTYTLPGVRTWLFEEGVRVRRVDNKETFFGISLDVSGFAPDEAETLCRSCAVGGSTCVVDGCGRPVPSELRRKGVDRCTECEADRIAARELSSYTREVRQRARAIVRAAGQPCSVEGCEGVVPPDSNAGRKTCDGCLSDQGLYTACKTYGIAPDTYRNLRSRSCEGCGAPPAEGKSHAIDHCHSTGAVRGVLCHDCNVALGFLRDQESTLLNLALYLRRNADYRLA